ncbi:MAG: hypothetical protein ABMB14_24270 [Myxococcota bacterium]
MGISARAAFVTVGVLVGVGGCRGGDDPTDTIDPLDGDTDTDTDTDPPVEDTAPDGTYLDAAWFRVSARFAYDPDHAEHVRFAQPGEGLSPISLTVTVIDSSVGYGIPDDSNSCTVTLEIDDGLPIAPWVATHGAWTGFDVPAGSTIRDNCRFYGLPQEFGGDAAGQVSKWTWGIGLGPLDEETEAQLRDALSDSEWAALEPFVLGGVAFSNLFGRVLAGSDGFTNDGYGIGYAVDGNFEVVVGGTGNLEPIEAAVVHPSGTTGDPTGVARGYYEVQLGAWGPATVLANEL